MSNGAGRDDIEHVLSKGYPGARPPEFSGGAPIAKTVALTVRAPSQLAVAQPTTRLTSFALSTSALVFGCGVLLQLMVMLWLAEVSFLTAGAGMVLLHSGNLDLDTIDACSKVALGINGILLIGLVGAWFARQAPASSTSGPPGLYERHPVMLSAVGLLTALGAVTAFAGNGAFAGAREITTTVMLANTYFFALLFVCWSMRWVEKAWSKFKQRVLASSALTGAWTAMFSLFGIGGFALAEAEWYSRPLANLQGKVELGALREADDAFEFQQAALCLAANEWLEAGASGTPPPECALPLAGGRRYSGGIGGVGNAGPSAGGAIAGGGSSSDNCFGLLSARFSPTVSYLVDRDGFETQEAEDFAMQAIVVTCTKVPPPENPEGYFFKVSRNQGRRERKRQKQYPLCEQEPKGDDFYDRACSLESDSEEKARLLSQFWEATLCHVGDFAQQIIRSRLRDGLSFREIGQRLNVTEEKARFTFANAIKKFRKRTEKCFPLED